MSHILLDKNNKPVDPADAPWESRADQDAAQVGKRWNWTACHYPERPKSMGIVYHDCCAACLIAAEANGEWMVSIMRDRLERLGPC